MREITSKVTFAQSNPVTSLKKRILISRSIYADFRSIIVNTLLKKIFPSHEEEGILLHLTFKNGVFSEKVLLETLRQRGLIQDYGDGTLHCDYPRFNFFGIYVFIENEVFSVRSWGYTLPFEDRRLALKKALGEALERQATFYYQNSSSVMYPHFKKGDTSFLYELIPHFAKDQTFKNSHFVANKKDMQNMKGFNVASLTGSTSKFLPAQCFYWGNIMETKDKMFQEASTSGSGGGVTKEDATLSALYELIERDLFMLYWYAKVKPSIITVDNESGDFFDYIRDTKERFNLEVYFFNLEYDIAVPACLCLVIDPVLNLIAIGSKVSSDGEAAMRGAFLEALATLSLIRTRKEQVSEENLQELIDLPAFSDPLITKTLRVGMYCSPLGIGIIKKLWLDDNSNKISYGAYNKKSQVFVERKDELAVVVAIFKNLVKEKGEGYHIYKHDFSSKFTELCNYYVVHVFVPSLLKLHLFEQNATPVSARLTEFAKFHGKNINSVKDVNPLPHLFP